MQSILIIEDDELITEPVQKALVAAGYRVFTATSGRQGLELALDEKPSLVLLDIMLPEMDGWQVCKALRAHSTVPIVMVTAMSDEVDRILGLELGADDYLTKPFSTRELVARIRANLRRIELERSVQRQSSELSIGEVRLDLDAHRAFRGKQELILRLKEFELLYLLMQRAGDAITRAEIFDVVWGTDWLGDTRTLDVHIRWLREKLEDDPGNPFYIQTVRGIGYRFISPEEL